MGLCVNRAYVQHTKLFIMVSDLHVRNETNKGPREIMVHTYKTQCAIYGARNKARPR